MTTPATPREALQQPVPVGNPLSSDVYVMTNYMADVLMERLAPFLRTPGTVDVCARCKSSDPAAWANCAPDDNCPVRAGAKGD